MNCELSFFKVISSCEKLVLPPQSVALMQGVVYHTVILRDVYKNLWQVEMERDGDALYFKKGWPRFYQENSLEPKDIMVFLHKRPNLFDFKLFGRDGCEKKGVGGLKCSVEERVEEFSVEDVEELIGEEEDETESNKDDDDDDEESSGWGDSEMVMEEDKDNICKKKSSSSLTGRSNRNYKKQNVGDCYGADIFKSGLAIRPKNAYFVSRSRRGRNNALYIPKDVIVDYNLEIPERLFIVDTSGKKWETKMKKWKDGRLWFTGGWKSLCNVNNIGMDDTCICEFVQQGRDALYMLVRPLLM